ncbi:acyl-CoA thioester hydrolase [Rhodobium orientis]|uniref:Tol-pal system-associated acyl-CoA thioesterase n=1 Tax=Rhodobium orientis TaxID=34017 RepID=A0A327JS83_9HYPH|nr:tol-pal system-associated acyl-CoA thioesterase [Rhodobium orientis]MBB4303013.1 acyl-CoA thioester hydrolase [Rhodobium orientis]MBK5949573.1 tol-pal system-associated acyl-CoA thioesterase [Rhodobium orientis]RAI29360.1 tol-pal system-associated acyl-CoA thioesterase [Rhodobium orientis]
MDDIALAGRIEAGHHLLQIRVYYEDTDFSGIVYHANYLKFMERGRTDFLRLCGVHHAELAAGAGGEALHFVVRHMELDFHAPARIDDVLTVETRFRELRGARMVLDQVVRRGATVLIGAAVTAAVINAAGRPRRLAQEMREKLGFAAG